ncbi:MAG: hypothetical protein AAF066_01870 [Pseudomonadota bacterium]
MYEEKSLRLKEAQKLLDASWHCSNAELASSLQNWIIELLQPLASNGVAEAQYIITSLEDSEELNEEEFVRRYTERLQEGAEAEIPEAIFYLAHSYWENGNYEKSAPLYQKAAAAGHAYSKWCYGLDLISGRGVNQDESAGLKLIEEAAKLKFEAAIQFMSDAFALGKYGFPKDESAAAIWQRELSSGDLIGL